MMKEAPMTNDEGSGPSRFGHSAGIRHSSWIGSFCPLHLAKSDFCETAWR
jgi:hypothetical protein